MQLTLLPTGWLRVQDQSGAVCEIGPEHPDYQRLRAQYQQVKTSLMRVRLFGLAAMVIGAAGWWYNWHLAETQGHFYIKLCILGPLGIFGGLLMLARPEWAGPIRSDSTRAHKFALGAVLGLMFV